MKRNFVVLTSLVISLTQGNCESVSANSWGILPTLYEQSLSKRFFDFVAVGNFSKSIAAKDDDDDDDDGEDKICLKQIQMIQESVKKFEMWSLEVLDAWGKIPAGILYGHIIEIGNFDECLNISKIFDELDVGIIQGKYCMAQLPFEVLFEIINPKLIGRNVGPQIDFVKVFAGLTFGICIPKSCSAKLIDKVFKDFLKDSFKIEIKNSTILVNSESCRTNDNLQFNAIDYVAIVLFSSIAVIMILSTIYDVAVCYFEKEPHSNLFTAFSIKTNGKKLFKIQCYDNSSNVIECLNGIRCLSIIWIVFGHEYALSFGLNFINRVEIFKWAQTPYSMIIQFGTLSVDTFFVLSGCLLAWVAFKKMEKSNGKLNIPLMYFHRYIRLTPVVAVLVLFMVSLYRFFGNGPFWAPDHPMDLCERNWWSTLLYVQNYVHSGEMCLGHSWYLAVDTQLYLISPLILIPLWKYGKIAFLPMIIAMQCSIAYIFAESMFREFNLNLLESNSNDARKQELIYYSTHSRISPWMIGIILGYYLYKLRQKKLKLSKLVVAIGWMCSLLIILAAVFGAYHRIKYLPNSGTTTIEGAAYEAFARISWAIALSWIIFACHKGYGGVVNSILSWGIWQPLGRLTYSIYLNHLIVQMILIANSKVDAYFSDLFIIVKFWGTFGLTLMVSVVTVLAFESPILELEKLMFKRRRNNKV